jgi:rod shape-determining protein MreD
MTAFSSSTQSIAAIRFLKLSAFCLILLALQAHLIQKLPYVALRVDLLLPLMFAIADQCSPLAGVFWAGLLGFVVDDFSGEFWGLHLGSYMATVCLVNMSSEKFDRRSPAYQMGLIGLCALGQSAALGLFLFFSSVEIPAPNSIWVSLGIRALLSATIAPFLIYPMLSVRYTI